MKLLHGDDDQSAERIHDIFMDYLKQYDGPLKGLAQVMGLSAACLIHFKNKTKKPSRITLNRVERYLINHYKNFELSEYLK